MSWGMGSDGHECIMGMEVVDVSVMGDGKRWTWVYRRGWKWWM